MTNVEVVESLKYGLKLFGYFLVVVILGSGGMTLGGALAVPIVTDGISFDNLAVPEFVGGVIIAIMGVTIWFTGMFGLTYKLLADSVEEGISSPSTAVAGQDQPEQSAPEPGPEAGPADAPGRMDDGGTPQESSQQAPGPTGPSPGEQVAQQHGPERAVPDAADVDDRAPARDASPEEEPPPKTDGASRPPETDRTPQEKQPPAGGSMHDASRRTGGGTGESPGENGNTTTRTTREEPAGARGGDTSTGGAPDRGTGPQSENSTGRPADSTDATEDDPAQREGVQGGSDVSSDRVAEPSTERTAEEIAFGTERENRRTAEERNIPSYEEISGEKTDRMRTDAAAGESRNPDEHHDLEGDQTGGSRVTERQEAPDPNEPAAWGETASTADVAKREATAEPEAEQSEADWIDEGSEREIEGEDSDKEAGDTVGNPSSEPLSDRQEDRE